MIAEERHQPGIIRGTFISVTILLVLFGGLSIISFFSGSLSLPWSVASGGIFFGEILLLTGIRIFLTGRARREPAPTLGAADYVTLARGFLLACAGGFIVLPRPGGWLGWIPGILYLLAIIGDGLDGYVARRQARLTALGRILDLEFDALATLLGSGLAILYQQIPGWYLFIGLGHYLFYAGIAVLRTRGKRVYPLPESRQRAMVGGANSFFLALALTPALAPSTATLLSIPVFSLIVFSFIRDWAAMTDLRKRKVEVGPVTIAIWELKNDQTS